MITLIAPIAPIAPECNGGLKAIAGITFIKKTETFAPVLIFVGLVSQVTYTSPDLSLS